jgi:hypothetical protein
MSLIRLLGRASLQMAAVWPQPAPSGCGPSTSATPKAFGVVTQSLQELAYNYKIVMIGKTNFQLVPRALTAASTEQPTSTPSATTSSGK